MTPCCSFCDKSLTDTRVDEDTIFYPRVKKHCDDKTKEVFKRWANTCHTTECGHTFHAKCILLMDSGNCWDCGKALSRDQELNKMPSNTVEAIASVMYEVLKSSLAKNQMADAGDTLKIFQNFPSITNRILSKARAENCSDVTGYIKDLGAEPERKPFHPHFHETSKNNRPIFSDSTLIRF